MAARGGAVKVRFQADTSDLSRGTNTAERDLDKLERSGGRALAGLKTAALGAGAALGVGLVVGLKSSVEAAVDAEKSQKKLIAQLHASDISYRAHAKEIDKVIQKHSQLAGIDDEDLQDAFTNIVRVTGSVSKSLKEVGLVTDIVRAKNIDVSKAGELVGKVMNGNVNVLKRYGVAVTPVTTAQDKLRESHDKVTVAQMRSAKEADKQATVQRALAAAQKAFGGQAEAYGKTSAGAMDRAGVAVENLQEALGAKLTPAVAAAANGLTKFINSGITVENLQSKLRHSLGLSSKDFEQFKQIVSSVFRAVLPVVREVIAGIVQRLQGMLRSIGGVVKLISSLLHGDFRGAWEGVKQIFSGAIQSTIGTVRAATAPFRAAAKAAGGALNSGFKAALNLPHELAEEMRDLIRKAPAFALGVGKAIVRGIVSGIKSAAGSIGGAISGAVGSVNPFGDGEGVGRGFPGLKIPALKGSLMGAQSALGPFAALGQRFGLHVSSGRRPGSITSSGNVSYHSSGEAIDVAGPPAGMMSFFKQMRSRFGSRLAELIYTPGGAGIKNGQPNVYTGQVAADHFDHVHVALDTGKAGVGDGEGKLGGQQLANLWVRAGGSSRLAGLMARVALAESGGNPKARNPSGASGLWQILGAPFKGNVFDPLTNAKMAVWKYKHQGLGAWAASKGSWGRYVDKPGITAGKGAGAAAPERVNPYEQAVASADVAIAGAEAGPASAKIGTRRVGRDLIQAGAVRNKQRLLGARIRKIRAALKGQLRPATRLRLTQELAGLLPEHAELGKQVQTLLHPAAPDAAVTDVGSADTGADAGGDVGDPNQPLIDAINASVEAEKAHTEAVKSLKDEIDKQNQIASSTMGIGLREATRALADMISGQIGGYGGVGGRALTAGAGTVVRY